MERFRVNVLSRKFPFVGCLSENTGGKLKTFSPSSSIKATAEKFVLVTDDRALIISLFCSLIIKVEIISETCFAVLSLFIYAFKQKTRTNMASSATCA